MANNKIAYGIAKANGINTSGMTPKQVWAALDKKGVKVSKDSESEELKDFFDKEKKEPKVEEFFESDEKLKDELVPKSLGAQFKNYDVKYGNKVVHLVEGTYIKNKEVIAGNGSKREIDEIDGLVKKYGGSADKWKKVKGVGTVDNNGKIEEKEIHWYEESSVGKVKMKVKES